MKGALAAGLLAALSLPLMPETLTMTTYYPAPVGIYNKMTTTGKTVLARDGDAVGVGTNAPDASAIIHVNSTTRGFLWPRMTTAQRDNHASPIGSPVEGLTIYNLTTKQIEFYDGTAWRPMGGGTAQMTNYGGGCPGSPFNGACGGTNCNNTVFTSGKNKFLNLLSNNGALTILVNGQTVSRGWNPVALVPPGATYQVQGVPLMNSCNFNWSETDF